MSGRLCNWQSTTSERVIDHATEREDQNQENERVVREASSESVIQHIKPSKVHIETV